MDLTPDGALGILDMIKYLKDTFKSKKQKEEEARIAEAQEAARVRAEQERAELEAEKQRKKEERATKRKEKAEAKKNQVSAKDRATAVGEPYIDIISVEIDETDPGQGAFELDWNDIFVARLIKAGYQGKTDQDIVDNWFHTVCRNILLETFEQEQADPDARKRVNKKTRDDGRSEFS